MNANAQDIPAIPRGDPVALAPRRRRPAIRTRLETPAQRDAIDSATGAMLPAAVIRTAVESLAHLLVTAADLEEAFDGARWVVASRLTPRLKAKGYEVAISHERLRRMRTAIGLPRLKALLAARPDLLETAHD